MTIAIPEVRRVVLIAIACSAFFLGSCAGMGGRAVPNIPGIGYSTLSAADASLRTSLAVRPAALPRQATYLPFRCSYQTSIRRMGSDPRAGVMSVNLSRVRDRLLFQISEGTDTSTALIGPDGRLFDFNLSRFLGGARVDSDNFNREADQQASQVSQSFGQTIRVINEFSVLFPHFATLQPRPGETFSEIVDSSGKPWGRYVFRGLASYQGRDVAVLDLLTDTGAPQIVLGYSVIDTSTMAPVFVTLHMGSTLRLDRQSCR